MITQKIIASIKFVIASILFFFMGVASSAIAKGSTTAYGISDPLTFIAWLNPFFISYCCFTFMLLMIWASGKAFLDPDWKGEW